MPHGSPCHVLALAGALGLCACASKPQVPVDPQIARCQQQSRSAQPSGMDQSQLALLTAHADAFAACLGASGYVFDETAMDRQLLHDELVWNSNQLSGDPYWYLAKRKQELRLSPALWRPGPRS